MKKIMFVCHGNICRSPMAEFVFKDLVRRSGLDSDFVIASSATSTEEIGNGVHRGTREVLTRMKVPMTPRQAIQLKRDDYDKYDLFIGMDSRNKSNMLRIFEGDADGKVHLLMDFTSASHDVADPWYTGDFDVTYSDVLAGTIALLEYLTSSNA